MIEVKRYVEIISSSNTDASTSDSSSQSASGNVSQSQFNSFKEDVDNELVSINALKADRTETGGITTLGIPKSEEPSEGSINSGSACVILNTPIVGGGQLFSVKTYVRPPGVGQKQMTNMYIYALSKIDGLAQFNVKKMVLIPLVEGTNSISLNELPELLFDDGDYVGYQSYYVGVDSGVACDSGGYWSGDPKNVGEIVTDYNGSPSLVNRLEVSFDIGCLPNNGYVASKIKDDIGENQFSIGKLSDFMDASVANADRTYLINTPSQKSGLLKTFRAKRLKSGYVEIFAADFDGTNYTATSQPIRISIDASSDDVAINVPLYIEAGQYIGFYASSGTLSNYNSTDNDTTDPETGRANYISNAGAGGGFMTTFKGTAGTPSVALQVGFIFDEVGDNSGLKRFIEMIEYSSPSPGWNDAPAGYILVFAIGQSNTSGRALALSNIKFTQGEAYKYVRSSKTLEILKDPTGNDATAAAGRGSWGPAFANEIRRLSNGKIGTIICNSAEGGTALSPGWQDGGQYWTQASTDLDNALADAASLKLPIVGCVVYFQQGESDGDNSTSTDDYKKYFANLKTLVDAKIGTKTPFLMTRIGTKNTGDTPEYAAIRKAQNEIATETDGVYLVHTGTKYFLERNLMMDEFHYVIAGYDEIGGIAGNAAFKLGIGQRPLNYND